MAEQTLLQIVQDACLRQGLPPTPVVVSSTEETVLQLWGLLNEEISELPYRGDFQSIRTRYSFGYSADPNYVALDLTTVPGYKNIYPGSLWNNTLRIPVAGPMGVVEWQSLLAFGGAVAEDAFRIEGNNLLLYPGHTASHTYTFEYRSIYGVVSADATPVLRSTFEADTDMPRFPTALVKAGLRWRWRAEKGQPYAEQQRVYENMVADELNLGPLPGPVRMDGLHENERVVSPGLLIAAGNWPL